MCNTFNKFIVFIVLTLCSFTLNAESTQKTEPLQKVGKNLDDATITAKIHAKFLMDKSLKPVRIIIDTKNGVVTLVGILDTDTQADKAITTAASTDGVRDVNADKLTVKESTQPMSDMLITAKIKGKLLQEKLMGNQDVAFWPVRVETKEGVAFISGQLDTKTQIDNVMKVVKSIQGVKDIKNLLTIKVAIPTTTKSLEQKTMK